MHIISWNVAGWSSTSRLIREDFGSIAAFLQRTEGDILCLQEVKGSFEKLGEDPFCMGASDCGSLGVDGWESFWAFSSKAHRGFNGVATFARKGVTWWCDSQPFSHEDDEKEKELNDEGRVVVTGHSAFVVVNTYVVNARHGLRLAFKMRFLSALRSLLLRLKKMTGLPVILLGDLNQTYRAEDACWSLRRLSLPAVLQLARRAQDTREEEWAKNFPALPLAAIRRLEVVIVKQVSLLLAGALEGQETRGPKSISVDGVTFGVQTDDGTLDSSSSGSTALLQLARRVREDKQQQPHVAGAETITLAELCDAGLRSVCVDALTRLQSTAHNRELFALTQYCGLPPHDEVTVKFMKELLSELRLYDTLLLPPKQHGASVASSSSSASASACPCPYTCWDQSRNKRMTNEGTRIDYILIDEALVPALVPCQRTENNIGVSASALASTAQEEPAGGKGAEGKELLPSFFDEFDGSFVTIGTRRSMAGGMYPAAPFDGSGLPPLSVAARDLQFRGLPSTGMFVTPPQYSDHCGVSAYFEGISLVPRSGKLQERHRCMYRPPVSLQALFAKRTRHDALATASTGAAVEKQECCGSAKSHAPRLEGEERRQAAVVLDISDDDESKADGGCC